jgi:3-methyl-2-oxobutanoate hydroxymethyltransferase
MIRIPDIQSRKARGEKIVMLTAYEAWMARILDATGAVDMLLVGDSVGMVDLGYDTTIPVTMNDMVRHTRAVLAGAPQAFVVADMPFLSHQIGIGQAMRNAGRLMQHGGASAVKLEGGGPAVITIARIVSAGIPVMGHLGLQP